MLKPPTTFRRALFIIPALWFAVALPAQRRGGGGGSTLPTAGASEFMVHGSILLAGGMPSVRLVAVGRFCDGRARESVFADSKGRFSFNLGVVDRGASPSQTAGSFSDVGDVRTCVIRASLPGYRPQTIALETFVKAEKANLGDIVLQPMSRQAAVLMSSTDADVPQKVRKDYEAGLDDAAKSKWPEAIAALEKATGAYGKFATAWLSLGMLQASRGNSAAALRSYAQAIAADEKFAPAYVELAAALTTGGDWTKAIEAAGKAITLDADAFPRAYYIAAVSQVRLNDADAAEKFAERGIRVDADHELPDLEYIEGILLFSKADVPGGRKHLESYLSYAPNGVNAPNARQQLAETAASK